MQSKKIIKNKNEEKWNPLCYKLTYTTMNCKTQMNSVKKLSEENGVNYILTCILLVLLFCIFVEQHVFTR